MDHWITEHWHDDDRRRMRIDSEILGQSVLANPEDLGVGEFLPAVSHGLLFEMAASTPLAAGLSGSLHNALSSALQGTLAAPSAYQAKAQTGTGGIRAARTAVRIAAR